MPPLLLLRLLLLLLGFHVAVELLQLLPPPYMLRL
jgi:hypothetical protein